ncbi:MAG: sigma-54-dependent Fis family transcriptional regulator [Deltaproteobacteria bacterium]|nr:sigma-54-dependent Fis family transcriptional regulator [Deltaproteobacteria bacterium]
MSAARILVVEDERAIRLAIAGLLKKEGYDVELAESAPAALSLLADERNHFDLVLTDLALGQGGTGMDVLAGSKKTRGATPVVMITAHGNERIAVEAMKAGAEDYVPKPFDNDQLRLVVKKALERTRLVREHRLLLDRIEREYGFGALIGSGPAMTRVFETIKKVAETDLGVLIRGESGTGKELVAQALHQASSRRERPFVAVNCAAISRELVESELFGHERGAFTGADARRVGRFEAALGGTIFLDEIGDMPPETQAKVLRVLQERQIERVGSQTPIPIEVRVVAATHRNLEAEVAAGRFRNDLYYRLKVVEIVLPPLRERVHDIPALAQRFLAQVATRLKRPEKALSANAVAVLQGHDWPGNVRELKNVIEQAAVLAPADEIASDDLDFGQTSFAHVADVPRAPIVSGTASHGFSNGVAFNQAKREATEAFERTFLVQALEAHQGNISKTAEAIGLVRQSLQQKLKELGIRPKG